LATKDLFTSNARVYHLLQLEFVGDEKVIDLLFRGLGGQKLLAHVEE
jgi:hypothetical protein